MMKTMIASIAIALTVNAQGQSLTVKSDAVKINFVADMDQTEGSVGGFVGKIFFDTDDLAKSVIQGNVDVNTLNTGNDKRDKHLKSADFFDAKSFSTMSFTSVKIVQKGERYVMTGKMKIKGTEREETITFSYTDKVFKGEGTIQLSYYKVGKYGDQKPDETNVKISFAIPVK